MDIEKILELARRHLKLTWVNDSPEDLIAFAQSVIEEEREAKQDATAIAVPMDVFVKLVKDVNTVKDLLVAIKAAEEE